MLGNLFEQTTVTAVFFAITIFGVIGLIGGSLFGADHDVDHDHDVGHDAGHMDHDDTATVSIFSTKVVCAFITGFGATGAIAAHYGAGTLAASLMGLGVGTIFASLIYGVLRLLYGQQSPLPASTTSVVGHTGTVTSPITAGSIGQVEVFFDGGRRSFLASSESGQPIPTGTRVLVKEANAGQLIVEPKVAALS